MREKKFTTWRPDTCGCRVSYGIDFEITDDKNRKPIENSLDYHVTISQDPKLTERICTKHSSLSGRSLVAVLLAESMSKNRKISLEDAKAIVASKYPLLLS